MNIRELSRSLPWQVRWLTILGTLCIALLTVAVLTNSSTYRDYRADLEYNRKECDAEAKAEHGKHSKECQTILYRTFDDPVALFTGALFLATVGLFVVTYGLFSAAVRQGRDTQRLFVQDQRPWLNFSLEPVSDTISQQDGFIIKLVLKLENIGKTPAYQAAVSLPFLHVGMEGQNEYFETTRSSVEDLMPVVGHTVLPGETIVIDRILHVRRHTIEESRNKTNLFSGYLATSVKYRSNITGKIHETSRILALNIDGGCALYLVEELHPILQRGIKFERLSALDVTT